MKKNKLQLSDMFKKNYCCSLISENLLMEFFFNLVSCMGTVYTTVCKI